MRLIEAIIDANHRALAGEVEAGVRPADFENELPIVALTCIDPRLNPLLPQTLGVAPEQFICLRNAGNIVTGPLSSTMRSLALACAVKGGKEIAIIGHTDCLVGKTSILQLLDALKAVGIERHMLPDNIHEYFGLFSSERQNVMRAVEIVRNSPIIGPKIPVHGLLVDTETGRLEWLVNGYNALPSVAARWNDVVRSAGQTVDALKSLANFEIGQVKFPETRIGETVTQAADWASEKLQQAEVKPAAALPASVPPPAAPPRLPLPPPIRPKMNLRRHPK